MQTEMVRTPDGLNLSVREWGNPDGPEIVLIHGQAQCHLCFIRQTGSPLAEKYRIIALDLRGHGASDKPLDAEAYHRAQGWADDVQAVLDAKRLRRPVLVGWSMGGRVIRNYLMHYGDSRLAGINFLASRPIEDDIVTGPGSRAMRGSDTLDLPARLRAEIGFLRDCFAKPPEGDDLLLMVAYNMIVPHPVRDAIATWSTDPAATVEALRRVTVPTLVTHGLLDRLILPSAAEMTAAAVKGARISWFDDCGHSPFYEDAPRYNRELDQFVAEASAGA
jgi:pimeloyl-ACP methyl ester carboxylesterase